MTTKEQILATAQNMFVTKSYNKTSVQNIIDEVGIAKGTFYHYFKSKEELLDELTTSVVQTELKHIEATLRQCNEGALSKLNLFLQLQSKWKSRQYELLATLLEVVYSNNNILYISRLEEKSFQHYAPILTEIIKQGVNEGVFDTPYPNTIGELLIQMSNSFSHILVKVFINHDEYEEPYGFIVDKMEVFLHSMERLIGLPSGAINMFDTTIIKEFIEYLERREN